MGNARFVAQIFNGKSLELGLFSLATFGILEPKKRMNHQFLAKPQNIESVSANST